MVSSLGPPGFQAGRWKERMRSEVIETSGQLPIFELSRWVILPIALLAPARFGRKTPPYIRPPYLYKAVLVGVRGGCRPRGHAELAEDVADVAIDGLLAQAQLACDRAVRLAGCDEPEHLQLARG